MDNSVFEIGTSPKRRKTKIVATVGPACRSPEVVRELILAGVNVFRLNFSHGSHAEHSESYATIRAVSEQLRMPVAVLQDLSGPKIRITPIDGNYAEVKDGAKITLHPSKGELSSSDHIYVEGVDPIVSVRSGDQILLADGIIALRAESSSPSGVVCSIVKGGRLRSRVGIAFPDSNIELAATTEKDFIDLEWGIENKVDYVAISFVQSENDIHGLREAMRKKGTMISIISKIERKTALNNIKGIVEHSDGLMVARGDLGLELPLETLPRIQKALIEEGNTRGIPVIVATQMMHSMITSVRPTRAEVSDIAGAVMSGADAVMLSEETSIGEHPVECVKILDRIVREAEKTFDFDEYKLRLRGADKAAVPDAVAYAACAAGIKVNAAAIIACTETGTSARLVAKYRPQQPVFGVSRHTSTLCRMQLFWGVMPIVVGDSPSHAAEIDSSIDAVKAIEGLPDDARCIIIGGAAVAHPGSTSILEIRDVKRR